MGKIQARITMIKGGKAAGPDGIPGHVLRACPEQLARVFMDILNLSLAQAVVSSLERDYTKTQTV